MQSPPKIPNMGARLSEQSRKVFVGRLTGKLGWQTLLGFSASTFGGRAEKYYSTEMQTGAQSDPLPNFPARGAPSARRNGCAQNRYTAMSRRSFLQAFPEPRKKAEGTLGGNPCHRTNDEQSPTHSSRSREPAACAIAFQDGGTRRTGRGFLAAETRRICCSACTTDIVVMAYQDTTNMVATGLSESKLESRERRICMDPHGNFEYTRAVIP